MIRGVLFDVNGTMTEIWTDEGDLSVYRTVSAFLSYQGVAIDPEKLRDAYFRENERQRDLSKEEYPEFDAVALFKKIIDENATDYTCALAKDKQKRLPELTAQAFRAATRREMKLYPNVKKTLTLLKKKYQLSVVSDGQSAWAYGELQSVGLTDYFDAVIVSGDFGYRKPDKRLFEKALAKSGLKPSEAVYVGNDMYRDVYGARQAGMKTVFYQSNQGDQFYKDTVPDATIKDFADLPNVIKSFEKEPVKK